MTYKETLFFIGKCLTINHEAQNKIEIEETLKKNEVDWDVVVKVSTSHYVFPALYCNYQRAGFLKYLPEDLVGYMEHITNLNRERNEQIIAQAKEINELLLANGITPIFLKGTGNLLEGLYEDIGERMVGDIDFLVSDEDYLETIKILNFDGYLTMGTHKHHFFKSRHYSRMIKSTTVAAIEIHNNTVIDKHYKKYKYSFFIKNSNSKDHVCTPSIENQIIHNCINKQLTDHGHNYKSITLRNCYDLFLLSLIEDALNSIKKHPHYFKIFNWYLGITSVVLNTEKIQFSNILHTRFKVSNCIFIHKYFFLYTSNKRFYDALNIIKKKINSYRIQAFMNSKGYRYYVYNQFKQKLNLIKK